jgi:uncharacterized protein (DUF488 family)
MEPTLLTVGYEHHPTPASLLGTLREAGVERLVDVRELPMSRRRGFSKTALSHALEADGIAYEHIRALGNPKAYRDLYRSGRQHEGERLYRAYIQNGSQRTVDELGDRVRNERICLLCFEAAHTTCHRVLIVDEVRKRLPTLRVEHL